MYNKTLIIAEAGVNHNGDISKAIELVHVAAEAKADIVKFQTFKANLLATKNAKTADYQKKNLSIIIFQRQEKEIKGLQSSSLDTLQVVAQ